MQIPDMNKYLLSIYPDSVLKVFKHFKSLQVWSLSAGLYGVSILVECYIILGNFRANRHG